MSVRLRIYVGAIVIGVLGWLYEKTSQPGDRRRARSRLPRCTYCDAVLRGGVCPECPRS